MNGHERGAIPDEIESNGHHSDERNGNGVFPYEPRETGAITMNRHQMGANSDEPRENGRYS